MTEADLLVAEQAEANLIALKLFRAQLDDDDSNLIKAIAASVTIITAAYPDAAADIKTAIIALLDSEVTSATTTFGAL